MYGWSSDDRPSYGTRTGGYDYSDARDAYKGARDAYKPTPAVVAESAKGKRISTESPYPVLVRIDVTGSNKANAATFWTKLPLLFKEAERYLPGLEISFAAIGDAHASDRYPLQVRDFKAGEALDAELNKLHAEGGGGGGCRESYELSAFFDLHMVDMPNARKPYLFLLCDEGVYEEVEPSQARQHVGVDMKESMPTAEVYKELMQRYNVYVFHSPYGGRPGSSEDQPIVDQWKSLVGDQRVLILEDAARVVDSIIGVLAAETGKFDDFKTRLTERQTKVQVKTVMGTLKTVTDAKAAADADIGKSPSKLAGKTTSGKTKTIKPLI
jgi:hypothetical protein